MADGGSQMSDGRWRIAELSPAADGLPGNCVLIRPVGERIALTVTKRMDPRMQDAEAPTDPLPELLQGVRED